MELKNIHYIFNIIDTMSDESAKEWLNTNWPNMCACDVNWTMKRNDYPDHVCKYIKTHWIKISDSGGGTYQQKYDYKKCLDETHILWRTENQKKMQKELDEKENKPQTVPEIIRNKIKEDPGGKAAAKLYQQTGFAKAMDEPASSRAGITTARYKRDVKP